MKTRTLILFLLISLLITSCLAGCSGNTAEQPAPAQVSESASFEETPAPTYTIEFYPDIDSEAPSPMTIEATYGVQTTFYTTEELGFSKDGYVFEGWRVCRESDGKWYLRNLEGKNSWESLVNGELPEGYVYSLRKDGGYLIKPTTEGVVRAYAQWGGQSFEVVYHPDDDSPASDLTTTIPYGEATPIRTIEELGFQKDGAEFKGWKLYREIDGKWYVKKANGKDGWAKLDGNGMLPDGDTYYLGKDGRTLKVAATSGVVHAYAQWNIFKVLYHMDEDSAPSDQTTLVPYGEATPMLTVDALGFQKDGAEFKGWKLYREVDGKWYVKHADGSNGWVAPEADGSLPQGDDYYLFRDGYELKKAASTGVVHAYAQWSD